VEVRIAVDTNRYREFTDGLQEAVERFRTAEQICVPFVVLSELRIGFLAGAGISGVSAAGARNARVLGTFLNRPRVRLLWPDEETTHQHHLLLCSRDAHFDNLARIPRA
jgi:predicted nucleic acid-binding protein